MINNEAFVRIGIRAQNGIGNRSFRFVECLLLFVVPNERLVLLRQFCDWCQEFCSIGNMILDEIDDAKESSDLFDFARSVQFQDCLDSFPCWLESSLLQAKSKEFDFEGAKFTLIEVDLHSMLFELLKDLIQDWEMLVKSFSLSVKNIVDVRIGFVGSHLLEDANHTGLEDVSRRFHSH